MPDALYPLPKKLNERNKLYRVLNLDTQVFDGHAILVLAKDPEFTSEGMVKLYAYPRDIWDDGRIFGSETKRISETMMSDSVDKSLIINAGGFGKLKFLWLLPPHPSRLPAFVRNAASQTEKLFANLLTSAVSSMRTTGVMLHTLENSHDNLAEFATTQTAHTQQQAASSLVALAQQLVSEKKVSFTPKQEET